MATGIGDALRSAREERGLSLSDAAEDTAISKRKLQALEDERWSVLEGDVYVKSSLRLYGRFLGIDPEPLVAEYRREYGDAAVQTPVQPVGAYHERISPVVTFAVVALVAIVGLGILGSLTGGDPDQGSAVAADEVPLDDPDAPGPAPVPTPTATPAAGAPDASEAAEPEATGPPPLESADHVELALNVNGGQSWVRIMVDEEMVLERTLEDGFSQTFTGDQIQMRIGNGAATDVVVNGQELQEFSSGEVVDLVCAAGQSSCVVD